MSARNPITQVHLNHVIKAVTVSSATDTLSTSVDTLGFTEALAILKFGTTTGTSGTATISIHASDATGGTYAAISGATTAALTLDSGAYTDKTVAIPVTLVGKNRWLKINVNTAGTVNTGAMQAFILLGGSENEGLPAGASAGGGMLGKTAYDVVVTHVK